jgi:hypothetical protein
MPPEYVFSQEAFIKAACKSHAALEQQFVAHTQLKKQNNTIVRGLREICENSELICQR